MKRWTVLAAAVAACVVLLVLLPAAPSPAEEQLWRHRNLGKAFYENPTTQAQAVAEFRRALALNPKSATDRLNYGLALLRAGKTAEGIAEIEQVQKQDPKLPHTWFNLGIEYKKLGEYDKAAAQFERMVEIEPEEPASHYNLGVLYKLAGKLDVAIREFETARRLDPNLAAPHFQLFNAYRQANRKEDAAKELQLFQEIKKRTEGAAVPEDMEWSFFSEIYDVPDPKLAADDKVAPVDVKFTVAKLAGTPLKGGDLAVTDADADGRADLLAWSEAGARLYRNGAAPVTASGLGELKGVVQIAPGDFDNDGLADLAVVMRNGAVLYRNRKGAYARHTATLPSEAFNAAIWLDYDHDNDLDLLLLGAKSFLFRNQGTAGFADRSSDFPWVTGNATAAVVLRAIADTKAMDLAVAYADRSGVLYRDKLAGKYEVSDLPLRQGARSLAAYDVNSDGSIDIGSEQGLLLNEHGRFRSVPAPWSAPVLFADLANRAIGDAMAAGSYYTNAGLGRFAEAKPTAAGERWKAADFNSDGKVDLAAVTADGTVQVLTNSTPSANGWMRVSLTGTKSALLAPYAEVEVKAGTRYQKKIYTGFPLHFGLRGYKAAESVRITWPNGLIQNELKQTANLAHSYKEAQRLSGSCPIIWTWNGKEFEYITDVLGVAPLGASSGDGQYFATDHDEYVQIRGEQLREHDGKLEVRITEELSEVAYIDEVKLIAVDHPEDIDIYTNEKFKGPPFPEFRLYGARQRLYPSAARDDKGNDVRARLLKLDRSYPDQFARTVSGVGSDHALDLEFPKNSDGVLILSGWVDWADGSTFLGVAQQGRGGLVPPYLQMKDGAGRWKTVIEDMGMPAGKPKTIAVDLTGKWISDSREVRVVTNLCVYWDEVFLAPGAASAPPPRLTTLDAGYADLRFRGFSESRIHPERKQPEMFFYARSSPTSLWNPTPGLYTRFGDVHTLLTEADDQFAIIGSGDEIQLLFDARKLPPLSAGHRRDYLLLVDGWAKDRDANTAHSQSVEPLPFHGMSRYPYPATESYPDDAAHSEYQKLYNTRPALRLMRPLAGAPPVTE